MFNLEAITSGQNGAYSCSSPCRDSQSAEQLRSSFIGPVRQINMFADLYCNGRTLIIEAPDKDTVRKVANILNHAAFGEESL